MPAFTGIIKVCRCGGLIDSLFRQNASSRITDHIRGIGGVVLVAVLADPGGGDIVFTIFQASELPRCFSATTAEHVNISFHGRRHVRVTHVAKTSLRESIASVVDDLCRSTRVDHRRRFRRLVHWRRYRCLIDRWCRGCCRIVVKNGASCRNINRLAGCSTRWLLRETRCGIGLRHQVKYAVATINIVEYQIRRTGDFIKGFSGKPAVGCGTD